MLTPMAIVHLKFNAASIAPMDMLLEELGSDLSFNVYSEGTFAFYEFILATLVSLITGIVMSACHRYTAEIGEFAPSVNDGVQEFRSVRLCDRLVPSGSIRRDFNV